MFSSAISAGLIPQRRGGVSAASRPALSRIAFQAGWRATRCAGPAAAGRLPTETFRRGQVPLANPKLDEHGRNPHVHDPTEDPSGEAARSGRTRAATAAPPRLDRGLDVANRERPRRLLAFAALELGFVAALQDDELDAAVLAPAVFVVLVADRHRLAVAAALEPARQHVALVERPSHGGGAPFRQIEVMGVVAALVGVPLDLDQLDLLVVVDDGRDGIKQRERYRLDLVLVGLEVDLVEDLDLPLAQLDHVLVGAAVVVLVLVVVLRLVRALVLRVED